MPATPQARPQAGTPGTGPARHLKSLPWRAYRFRVLGMGLASLPLIAVMHELGSPWPAWAWMAFGCFAWPHLAYFLATRSADPFKSELRNFMFDSILAGSWVPVLHFNLLPSAVLVTVVTADKINTGVRGLWLRSLPGMAGAIVLGGLLTGFAVDFPSSTTVVLACLPIMIIHTLAVSQSSYQLVRRVQKQNLQLAELSRRDLLTGLDSRGHWQAQAEALLQRHQAQGQPASLMLIDVDCFKEINDRYGHTAGDDVLRGIAELIRSTMPAEGHAGRLGGDEFALALPVDVAQAATAAETLRIAVEALGHPHFPGLRCSISIGLAEPPEAGLALREWREAADRALYQAKHGGRNRTAGPGVKAWQPTRRA